MGNQLHRGEGGEITEDVGDEDDGGLGVAGGDKVGLHPAGAFDDLAFPASGVQRRRATAALRAGHSLSLPFKSVKLSFCSRSSSGSCEEGSLWSLRNTFQDGTKQ